MSTPTQPTTPTIDFEAIKKSVSGMSKQDLTTKLEKFRARQLFQQKKQAAKGSQALYNKKRNEEFKTMKAEAQNAPATDPQYKNLWEEIEAKAKIAADTKLEEFLDKQLEETGEAETEEQPA